MKKRKRVVDFTPKNNAKKLLEKRNPEDDPEIKRKVNKDFLNSLKRYR